MNKALVANSAPNPSPLPSGCVSPSAPFCPSMYGTLEQIDEATDSISARISDNRGAVRWNASWWGTKAAMVRRTDIRASQKAIHALAVLMLGRMITMDGKLVFCPFASGFDAVLYFHSGGRSASQAFSCC